LKDHPTRSAKVCYNQGWGKGMSDLFLKELSRFDAAGVVENLREADPLELCIRQFKRLSDILNWKLSFWSIESLFRERKLVDLALDDLEFWYSHFLLLDHWLRWVPEKEVHWVIQSRSIYRILSDRGVHWEVSEEIQRVPQVSEVKLLKIFSRFNENPGSLHPVQLCCEAVLKIGNLGYFGESPGMGLYFLLLHMLKLHKYPLFELDPIRHECLFQVLENPDQPDSHTHTALAEGIIDAYRYTHKHFIPKPGARPTPAKPKKRIFKKSDAKPPLPPEIASVETESMEGDEGLPSLKKICMDLGQTAQRTHSSIIQDLGRVDQDVSYHFERECYLEERLQPAMEKYLEAFSLDLDIEQVQLCFETSVWLTPPPDSGSRRKLPKNRYNLLTVLLPDSVRIYFLIVLNTHVNPEGDSEDDPSLYEGLEPLVINAENPSPPLSDLKARFQENFYLFLARLEDEALKTRKSRAKEA